MSTIENQPKISNLNTDLDLDILKIVFRKTWFYILFSVIIGLLVGFIYLRYTKPLYEANAVIQRSSKDEGQRILEFNNFDQENNLSVDVELLKSPFLLEKTIKDLNLKISYFSEGKFLTEEKFTDSPYHINFIKLKDSSLINKPIFIENINDDLIMSFMKDNKKLFIKLIANSEIENQYFKLKFKVNNQVQFENDLKENTLYFRINDYAILTNSLKSSLYVSIINKEANTIEIAFRSNNKTLAKELVNQHINTFFKYDLEKRSQSSANILSFIDNQLDTVYSLLKYSENDLQSFKSESKTNNPELYKENVLSQIEKLRGEALDADLEYDLITGINKGIKSKSRIEIYNLIPQIIGSRFQSLLEDQLNKLYALLEEKEDASYVLTNENETYKKLEVSINNQVETVDRTLKSIKNQVKVRRDRINQIVAKLESQLYGVSSKELELADLNRSFNLNEKYYSLLIEKRTQYEISKAGFTIDNIELQTAGSTSLIFPNKRYTYIIMFILSFLVGLILIAFKYITFNVIHNESELMKLIPNKVGFLGSVPNVNMEEENSILKVHLHPKSRLTEHYRHIRTNLQFILDDQKSNVIAVSSSVSGEGKTFVSLNLAGIYTMANKKVIVLDLDLRKPKIHLGFGVENKHGMSDVLASKSNWKELINNSELNNLHFITAGTIPPNPSELILNGKLDVVIEELKLEYDIIIIDNPPIGMVADGVNIMNNSDCPIYIFRANYSKRVVAQNVRDLVSQEKVKDLYVILNDVSGKSASYGYGYGYGYGNGYYSDAGNESKSKKSWYKLWK